MKRDQFFNVFTELHGRVKLHSKNIYIALKKPNVATIVV